MGWTGIPVDVIRDVIDLIVRDGKEHIHAVFFHTFRLITRGPEILISQNINVITILQKMN